MHLALLRNHTLHPEQVPDITGHAILALAHPGPANHSGELQAPILSRDEEALTPSVTTSIGLNEKEIEVARKAFGSEASNGEIGTPERTPLHLALCVSPLWFQAFS